MGMYRPSSVTAYAVPPSPRGRLERKMNHLAQKNAAPTKAQAEALKRAGLAPIAWAVVRELPHSLIVKNRLTGEFKVIDK